MKKVPSKSKSAPAAPGSRNELRSGRRLGGLIILALLATALQASRVPARDPEVPTITTSAEFYQGWSGLVDYVVLPPGATNLLVPCLPDLACIPLVPGPQRVPEAPEPGTWVLAGLGVALLWLRTK